MSGSKKGSVWPYFVLAGLAAFAVLMVFTGQFPG